MILHSLIFNLLHYLQFAQVSVQTLKICANRNDDVTLSAMGLGQFLLVEHLTVPSVAFLR